jgi:cold shock CspA family protein
MRFISSRRGARWRGHPRILNPQACLAGIADGDGGSNRAGCDANIISEEIEMRGTVKTYNERGFGFIKPLGHDDADVFFHKTAVADGVQPEVDMVVEFELVEKIDERSWRMHPANVRPIA